MPGRLRNSFRSGNLAEHLGILLLKGVSAVAEVSRPEDVGLDAVATLLRRDDDGNSYAEESFVVQLKSESTRTLEYQGHEVEWLIGQRLPMFIGKVSLAESKIGLYSTIFIDHAVLALHSQRISVRFGPSDIPPFFGGQEWGPWRGESGDSATVWLGPPVLEWSLGDIVDDDWAARAYSILKRFLGVLRREKELLSLGQSSIISWSTNNVDAINTRS